MTRARRRISRLQLRLTAWLAGLVIAIVSVSGVLAERGLVARERARIDASLAERTALVAELVAGIPFSTSEMARLDALADRAAEIADARVTLISREGVVLGDSDVSTSLLPDIESHADRPEVRAALSGSIGTSSRSSTTVWRPLEYLAIPVEGGVVRLAVDLDTIEEMRAELRRELLIAGMLGLAAALVLSYFISGRTLRPVGELREVVQAIAAGDLSHRLRWREGDDLREIAGSINSMAEQLGQRLDDATAEKEELEAVLTSMVEGVLVLDGDRRIVLANPRCRELLSLWGEVEGRLPIEVIRNPQLDSALERAAREPVPVVDELEIGPGSPEERHLLVHAVSLAPGAVRARTVAVFHDVTEIRRLEQVRSDFIANASHELRTPLTAIRGFAETLATGHHGPEEIESHIDTILRNAQRLQNLIEDLLDLSRIESRKVPLRPSEIDVSGLCRQLVEDMKLRLADASLTVSVDGAEPVLAWADHRGLEQVLANLLDNAVTYSNAGGHIAVSCWREGSKAFIAIQDTGIGIPAQDQNRIFERFYRVDSARSRALGGTGLGLSIVKHIVQSMGGSVSLESEVGKGSRFVVSLTATNGAAEIGAA